VALPGHAGRAKWSAYMAAPLLRHLFHVGLTFGVALLKILIFFFKTCVRSDIVELLSQPTEECSTRGDQLNPGADALRTTQKTASKTDACTERRKEDARRETLLHLLLAQTNDMWGHAFLLAQSVGEHEIARLTSQ